MKNTIRCCISCILPCGALDVIRIVHSNGRVEEIAGTIRAGEIMKAHPKHVLKKPTTCPYSDDFSGSGGGASTIVVVPPDAQLQRGKIYFLSPVGTTNPDKKKKNKSSPSISSPSSEGSSTARRKRRDQRRRRGSNGNLVVSDDDQYLSEILSEKIISSTQPERRRRRVGVWRPHLESISETLCEAAFSDH